MKLTNKERDLRLIKYYLIPGILLISLVAAFSGKPIFLFSILATTFMLGAFKLLFYNQRYAAAWPHKNGELKVFLIIQLILVLFIGAISMAASYGILRIIQMVL